MTNYLLISSTYRDRLLYPNPAEFTVPFGSINNVNHNTFNVFTTTNPITKSFPEYNNCWTNFESPDPTSFSTKILSVNRNEITVDTNVNNVLLGLNVPVPGNPIVFHQQLEQCYDVLRGFFVRTVIDGVEYFRLIDRYDPISSILSLRNPFPVFEIQPGGNECSIVNTFSLNPNSVINNTHYVTINGDFLRNSPLIYYSNNIFIYNVTRNEFRKTIQYEEEFHKYKIEKPFTDGKVTDQFFLLGNVCSSFSGNLEMLPNHNFYTYVPSSFVYFSTGLGYSSKMKIILFDKDIPLEDHHVFEIDNVSILGQILDTTFRIVEVGKQQLHQTSTYSVRPTGPSDVRQEASLRISSFSLVFSLTFKNQIPLPSSLIGMYFFPIVMSEQYQLKNKVLNCQPNGTIISKNKMSEPIDLLNSQTKCGVCGIKDVYQNDTSILLVTQQYADVTKLDVLSTAIQNNNVPSFAKGIDNFLILNFSSEGVVPLNYTGSQITNSQMSCYELNVTSLILPNVILQTTSGLLTSSYPYVFLEISNESLPSSGNTDIIYSNNPNSSKVTFVCPTLDVNNPEVTKFIKIGAGSGSQIMKFSPFDNLKIRVSLPNGETFSTEIDDNLVPNSPNPRIQITLLLEITKL